MTQWVNELLCLFSSMYYKLVFPLPQRIGDEVTKNECRQLHTAEMVYTEWNESGRK